MNRFTLKWTIQSVAEGILVREFLKTKGISKAALTDIKFHGGAIEVNGEHASVRHKLQAGEELQVFFPVEERSEGMIAENIPLCIVYEDDAVLVMNKEAYMSTIPSREHPSGSVANALLYHYDKQHLASTVHIVTRLDRDTSGLMLIAKNRFVHHLLSKQHQQKGVKRTYEAIVHGMILEEVGTIDAPIGRKADSIIERTVCEDGQRAVTHFKVMESFPNKTRVALELETGRTHQIRVHMAHIGHPLLGDDLYGGQRDVMKRQALHSTSLTFYHPILEKEMTFTSSIPDDMQHALRNN
ncbi:pseudouridine synthase [Bacillus cereus]|uniref:Pseudouridine synthase n=1 Tax=Bacillus paramycoides TaxID=2026194 RepID=A0A1J9UW35_9BACI|nr:MULTISPECIES: RluA family pseudouridine synthase [Bacillus]EJR56821.1 RluA family pseudouridine synthase [Bacillus cereus VD107]PFM59499.1 pseudouridine synthase [Bacillus cereus]KMN46883.1 pseudouridine synthase [Bacillus sp. LK2]MED0965159.1 RluA family pseudouridine synthase [Bacillus paramycoides]MED0971433.1 RluA family pseudouridine synthase [Bacillus paramycoides]